MVIIDEVRQLRDAEVAKKQDAAKLNYPLIIEKIKQAATKGYSKITMGESEINECDKKLLEQDGFNVRLIDAPKLK